MHLTIIHSKKLGSQQKIMRSGEKDLIEISGCQQTEKNAVQ